MSMGSTTSSSSPEPCENPYIFLQTKINGHIGGPESSILLWSLPDPQESHHLLLPLGIHKAGPWIP